MMPNEIKAFLFMIFTLVFGGAFFFTWIGTGSIYQALYFLCQLILLFIAIPVLMVILYWIGTKIFHD